MTSMNSENRADLRRRVRARDRAQARVRSVTVAVAAASAAAVGALALHLPGSAHASEKPGVEQIGRAHV